MIAELAASESNSSKNCQSVICPEPCETRPRDVDDKKAYGSVFEKVKNIYQVHYSKGGFITGTFNFNHPQQNVWNFQPLLSIVVHMRGPKVPGFLADLILVLLFDAVNSVMIMWKGTNNKFKIINPDEVAKNQDEIVSKPNMIKCQCITEILLGSTLTPI